MIKKNLNVQISLTYKTKKIKIDEKNINIIKLKNLSQPNFVK
jgi:hypothetical protein